MRPVFAGLFTAIAILSLVTTSAHAKSVAVSVSGAKGSGFEKIEKQVRSQLAERNIELVTDKALNRAAKKLKDGYSDEDIAKEAGSDLFVTIFVKKVKKKFTAQAKLIDLSSGNTLISTKKSYKKATSAPDIGDAMGAELGDAAVDWSPPSKDFELREKKRTTVASQPRVVRPSSGEEEEEEEEEAEPEKPARSERAERAERADRERARARGDEDRPERAPKKVKRDDEESDRRSAALVPKDEEGRGSTSAKTAVDRGSSTGGEEKALRFTLGVGSQVSSAYTVVVGGAATGLAYKLSPLVLFEIGAAAQIPNTGLGVELNLSYVPVKYQIDVDPPVDPGQPGGRFLDVAGIALYKLTLSRFGDDNNQKFYLAPQLGVAYASLGVAPQEPAVVLSSSMTAAVIGARIGFALTSFMIEADARFKLVLSYSETPRTTGQDGGGNGFGFGLTARYWMSPHFGMFFRGVYDYSKIGFTGEGDRTPFLDDPILLNASALFSDLRASVGLAVAL